MRVSGLDNIASWSHLFKNRRLGLVTTSSAVDFSLHSSVEVLTSQYDVRALFAPEHGLYSDGAAGSSVETALTLIHLLAKHYPGEFSFLPADKQGSMMSFERLAGKDTIPMLLSDLPHLIHSWEEESALFTQQKQRFHLYQ